jgi:hypothetical protein
MGKILSYKKIQYACSKKMFNGRAKKIRIIGVPDKQLPD